MKHGKLLTLALCLLSAVWIASTGMASQPERRQSSAIPQTQVLTSQGRPVNFDMKAQRSKFKISTFPRQLASVRGMTGADANVTLYGITTLDGMPSLVSFPAASFSAFDIVKQAPELETSGGGVYADGRFYNFSLEVMMGQVMGAVGHVWDPDEWTLERTIEDLWSSSCARDLAYDPVSGRVYGQFYQDDMQDLWWGWIDTQSGSSHFIGRLGVQIMALGCNAQGEMYAVIHNGKVIKLNKDEATYETIGNTGLMPRYIQSGTIDPATGKFYWAAYLEDNTSGLYEVDLETAQATLLSAFPDNAEITGLFIMPAAAVNDAPDKVAFEDIFFENGSLSGRIKVKTPENTYGGDPISDFIATYLEVSGPDGYTKDYDDDDWCGATITFRISVPKAGLYTFTAYSQNDAGKGPSKTVSKWIGPDMPVAPTDLNASLSGNIVTLTWTAPVEGINGGYVNPDDLTYDVVRLPDNKAVATGLAATTVPDELPDGSFASYQYKVIPVNGEQRGRGAVTSPINYGSAYQVPVNITIRNKEDRDLFSIIDGNNDGATFTTYYTGAFYIEASSNDDWVVSPPVSLKAGTQYSVKFQTFVNNSLFAPEHFEIRAGKGADAASLNMPVADFERLQCFREDKLIDGFFTPEEDGVYYFGFHDLTNPSSTYVEVNYFSIEEGPSLAAPLAVTELTATAAERGELKATLGFKAPLKDYAGKDLTAISRIDILRGGQVIGSIDNPAPGSAQTYTDDKAQQGDNVYTVKPYGANDEEGETAEVTVYVGVDTPSSPTNVKLVQEGNNVILIWDAPTTGANGGYIDPEKCVYAVYSSIHDGIIEEGITGTRWGADITSMLKQDQFPLFFGVYALNAAGGSTGVPSNTLVIGAPYDMPFSESFQYGYMEHEMWIVSDAKGDCEWQPTPNDGADGFIGCAVFSSSATADQRLSTGKIDLSDATEPFLEFWCRGNDESGRLDIEVTTDYINFTTVKSIEFKNNDWHKVEIPLTQYAGAPSIMVGFHAYGLGESYYDFFNAAIDEVKVEQRYADNLRAHAISASKTRIEIGEEPVQFTFNVMNRGKNAVSANDWTLSVFQDSKERNTLPGLDIEPGKSVTVNFDYVPTFDDPDKANIAFGLNFAKDMYTGDDRSELIAIQVDKPEWPVVTDLYGKIDSETGMANLHWTAPDLSDKPAGEITDSFEDYNSFDIEKAGDWTLCDVDQSFTYTITGFTWPHTYMQQAWIVWTPGEVQGLIDDKPLSEVWWPHSGDKCMACFAGDEGLNDDWLISPELSGNAQELAFWARSTVDEYGQERFEVWYSETDTEVGSFKRLGDNYTAVASEWTEYKFQLPEGARYFAIRCVSPDRFCLLVDDVTFERAARRLPVEFKGYNVYVDGKLANDVPLKEPSISLNHSGKHEYFVKVSYDKGESARSNVVMLEGSGIDTVAADAKEGRIYDLSGCRILHPVPGNVYVRNGQAFIYLR